ncbi:hypothetical protein V1477_005254 [Vespula maculifrons]|uniref:Uncharacterized protein n=1 Tax=Vespula maculifrons TaxID=7453 RepID=A0ABD2CQ19_VESMC
MEGERSETRKNNVCENSEVIENSVFGLPIWSLPLVSSQLLGNLEGKYLSSSGRTKERNEEERSPSWDKDNVRTSELDQTKVYRLRKCVALSVEF